MHKYKKNPYTRPQFMLKAVVIFVRSKQLNLAWLELNLIMFSTS